LAAIQAAPAPIQRPGRKAGKFLIVAGAAFAGIGAYVFTLSPEEDPSNERWRLATGCIGVGFGTLFIVLGALTLKHPSAPQLQIAPGRVSISRTITF
jgi:hypothetical protein